MDYPEGRAYAQVWRAQVERVPLCLLDTDIPENTEPDLRNITDYLYGGDSRTRIRQAMLLGIGGYRTLAELGISPTVCHINEGHSAFLAVERIRQLMEEQNLAFHEVREATFTGNIFTTHTPVPAGIDIFPPDLVDSHLSACTAHGQKLRFFSAMAPGMSHPHTWLKAQFLAMRSIYRANLTTAHESEWTPLTQITQRQIILMTQRQQVYIGNRCS